MFGFLKRNPIRAFFKAARKDGIEFEMPVITDAKIIDIFVDCSVVPRLLDNGEVTITSKDKASVLERLEDYMFIWHTWRVQELEDGGIKILMDPIPREQSLDKPVTL